MDSPSIPTYREGLQGIREETLMMLKDIQALENAARMAMAGNDDPLAIQAQSLKPSYYGGLAFLIVVCAGYLFFA